MIFVNIMVWVYIILTFMGIGILMTKMDTNGNHRREPVEFGYVVFSLVLTGFAYYAASLYLGVWVWALYLIGTGITLSNYSKPATVNIWFSALISTILAFFALKGIGVL